MAKYGIKTLETVHDADFQMGGGCPWPLDLLCHVTAEDIVGLASDNDGPLSDVVVVSKPVYFVTSKDGDVYDGLLFSRANQYQISVKNKDEILKYAIYDNSNNNFPFCSFTYPFLGTSFFRKNTTGWHYISQVLEYGIVKLSGYNVVPIPDGVTYNLDLYTPELIIPENLEQIEQ